MIQKSKIYLLTFLQFEVLIQFLLYSIFVFLILKQSFLNYHCIFFQIDYIIQSKSNDLLIEFENNLIGNKIKLIEKNNSIIIKDLPQDLVNHLKEHL